MQVLLLHSLWSSNLQPPSSADTVLNSGHSSERHARTEDIADSQSKQQRERAEFPPRGKSSSNFGETNVGSSGVEPEEPLLESAHKAATVRLQ